MVDKYNLDLRILNHHYITKLIIFGVFLFSDLREDENEYEKELISFMERRIKYDLKIGLRVFPKCSKNEFRYKKIRAVTENLEIDEYSNVSISYKTSLKDNNIIIDLKDFKKYETYILY